jgi:hypothetical protein
VIASLEDWGENLLELKKSTTPYDGFLPLEGEDIFSKESLKLSPQPQTSS